MVKLRNISDSPIDGVAPGAVGSFEDTPGLRRMVDLRLLADLDHESPRHEGEDDGSLRARFDRAWKEREGEHAKEVADLRATIARLEGELRATSKPEAATEPEPKPEKARARSKPEEG